MSSRPRILVATSNRAECDSVASWLVSEGFDAVPVWALAPAVRELETGSFDAILADSAFAFSDAVQSIRRVKQSRAPLIVVGQDAAGQAAAERLGFMYVSRPIDRAILMCNVAMALVESRPARRSPRKLVPRFEALVQGMPGRLVDVSNEGMRLELPRDSRRTLPPVFTVRVPLVGVGLSVQRVWLNAPRDAGPGLAVCGGALYDNAVRSEQGWRKFVDVIPAR